MAAFADALQSPNDSKTIACSSPFLSSINRSNDTAVPFWCMKISSDVLTPTSLLTKRGFVLRGFAGAALAFGSADVVLVSFSEAESSAISRSKRLILMRDFGAAFSFSQS